MADSTYRPLRAFVSRVLPPASPDPGPRAQIRDLALDRLVIDDRYQRSIGSRGRTNVLRIMSAFDWRRFTPVVVTPIEDGRYAIIDGQHRATAALMHPDISTVPCMIVDVSPQEAASCFAAINGDVTAVTSVQLFHARVAAGEENAVALKAVLDIAGVVILKSKQSNEPYRVGETFAIGMLETCLRLYGRDTLITALQAITQSGDGNAGCLTAPMIRSLCEILHDVGVWRDAGSKLLQAMDELNLLKLIAESESEAKQLRIPAAHVIKRRMVAHLVAALAPKQTTRSSAA